VEISGLSAARTSRPISPAKLSMAAMRSLVAVPNWMVEDAFQPLLGVP
jgi:hypothetical protein